MNNHAAPRSEQLPTNLRAFVDAHHAHDADTAVQYLADDVVAVDQGQTWRGREEVRTFVRDAGAEFEYTTEEIGTRRIDDDHYVIGVRLEGTFPGGRAELDYRFTLRDGLISEIVIGAHEACPAPSPRTLLDADEPPPDRTGGRRPLRASRARAACARP